jgi:hypothetical protein
MPALRNARQEILAQALATGKTQVVACQEAGYRVKDGDGGTASRYVHHPDVQVRKAEIIRERFEAERKASDKAIADAAIDKGYIVSRLKYLADRSIRGTKPVYDSNGVVVGWLPAHSDGAVAHSCLKTLAHMGGYLIEKVEIGGPGDHARLTDDELMKELVTVGESIGLDPKQVQKAIAGSAE